MKYHCGEHNILLFQVKTTLEQMISHSGESAKHSGTKTQNLWNGTEIPQIPHPVVLLLSTLCGLHEPNCIKRWLHAHRIHQIEPPGVSGGRRSPVSSPRSCTAPKWPTGHSKIIIIKAVSQNMSDTEIQHQVDGKRPHLSPPGPVVPPWIQGLDTETNLH